MIRFSYSLLAILFLGTTTAWSTPSPPIKLKVKVPRGHLTPAFVEKTGFIRDHHRNSSFYHGYVNQKAFFQYTADTNVPIEVLGLDLPVPRENYEGYHNYEALTAELQRLVTEYPNLLELKSAGKSVEGRELWYVILSDRDSEPEPKFLYIANMHGDETVGRELMIYLSRLLLEQYQNHPRIANLLDHAQIFIMPSMNPDGFERGTRWNANGVDLNRNFPDAIKDPNNTLEGRAVETQAIMKLNVNHHFLTSLNWHGGEICLNLPWDNRPNNKPSQMFGDDPFLSTAARKYADLNRPMYNNHHGNFNHGVTYGYEWYPVYGGMQDYFAVYAGSAMATGELSYMKWPSSQSLAKYWGDNREALLSFLLSSMEGVHFHVTNIDGETLNKVTVRVDSAPRRRLTYPSGYLHKPTVAGPQRVTLEVDGYAPFTTTVQATPFSGSYQSVVLVQN